MQRFGEHFLSNWETVCKHGPYGDSPEQFDVNAIEQELWSSVEGALWKDGKPHTGKLVVNAV